MFRVNGRARADDYPVDGPATRSARSPCSAVAYFCTFGSELAVVSMLPTFFSDTWSLGDRRRRAGRLVVRLHEPGHPTGRRAALRRAGSRRRTLTALLAGLAVGNVAMAMLGSAWPLLRRHRRVDVLLGVRPGRQRGHLRGRAAGQEAGERPDLRPGRRLRQHRRHRLPHDAAVRVARGSSSWSSPAAAVRGHGAQPLAGRAGQQLLDRAASPTSVPRRARDAGPATVPVGPVPVPARRRPAGR